MKVCYACDGEYEKKHVFLKQLKSMKNSRKRGIKLKGKILKTYITQKRKS